MLQKVQIISKKFLSFNVHFYRQPTILSLVGIAPSTSSAAAKQTSQARQVSPFSMTSECPVYAGIKFKNMSFED